MQKIDWEEFKIQKINIIFKGTFTETNCRSRVEKVKDTVVPCITRGEVEFLRFSNSISLFFR